MAYKEAWVIEAKKMIKTKRYKNIPARHLEHFDFNLDKDFYNDRGDGCSFCDENENSLILKKDNPSGLSKNDDAPEMPINLK